MDPKHWTTLCLVLVVLATLLQVAGYASPLWLWINKDGQHVGISLWYQTKSDNFSGVVAAVPSEHGASSGKVFLTDIDDYRSEVGFNVVRGMETAALVGLLLLLVFLPVYRVGIYTWPGMRSLNLLITVVAVLTMVAITTGVVVYCAVYWNVVGSSPRVSPTSFPWSLLLCFAAVLVLLVVAVLMRTKCRPRKLDVALPVSGDAKMELHPTTKNGAVQRYFTPSPYSEDRRSGYQTSAYYTEADAKAGPSMYENPAYRSDLQPEPQELVPSRLRESPRLLSEVPRGPPPRYGGGEVERVTTTATRYVTSDVDRVPQRAPTPLPRPVPNDADAFYSRTITTTTARPQPESEHIFYTGRTTYTVPENGYATRDVARNTSSLTRNDRDINRFSGDGRMVAQSHVYDLRPGEYNTADLAVERSVHMDRTRGASGPKVVMPNRSDVGGAALNSGYIYRPYSEMRY